MEQWSQSKRSAGHPPAQKFKEKLTQEVRVEADGETLVEFQVTLRPKS